MDTLDNNNDFARGPEGSESYEELLKNDSRTVPDFLHEGSVPDLGLEPIPASNYFSREYFDKEVKSVWDKVWQMACREEDIPNVGDYHLYENVGKSLIVARVAPDEIRAYHNVCLHRGRKLVSTGGCRKTFQCRFHGMTWDLKGKLAVNPLEWDLPQWKDQDMSLPQAKVETWGGFVFINVDTEAAPLSTYIEPMARDLDRYDFANSYKALHLVKKVRCNWKVLAEAFMEATHTTVTHPQSIPYVSDLNAQYDILSNYVSRSFVALGAPSHSAVAKAYTPTDIVRAMGGRGFAARDDSTDDVVIPELPEGVGARAYLGDVARRVRAAEDGFDYSSVSDAELIDSLLYNLWPHMSFWAGYVSIYYSWRPNEMDPESCIMEVMVLKRVPNGAARPRPAKTHYLGLDELFATIKESGKLGVVFDQDLANVPFVQEGLHALRSGVVHFGRYTEFRLRKMHQLIDEWIERDEASLA
jgi:phenylpropionate dioxygenase-like ring-hydroxylating dioxygenase large terminal subunit